MIVNKLKSNAEKFGSVTILHLHGLIVNGVETETLRNAVFSHDKASEIVLDFTRVDRIDAGGLGVLLKLREWAQSRGIKFRLINLSRLIRHVFEMTRLDSVFEIHIEGRMQSAA